MRNYIHTIIIVKLSIILQCYQTYAEHQLISQETNQNPCPTGALKIFNSSNAPLERKNRWRGIILLDQWPNEDHIMLELHLSQNASLSLGNRSSKKVSTKYIHRITMSEPTSIVKQIHFEVDGKPDQGFPKPTGLFLNGFDICNCTRDCPESSTGNIQIVTVKSRQYENNTKTSESLNNVPTTPKNNDLPTIDVKINNNDVLCGKRKKFHKTLIRHGYDIQPGEYPWHAAIFLRKESDSPNIDYICGGSLVSKSTVITAAHCVHESDHTVIPQRILVKLGLHNRLLASSNTQEFRVYEILVPPTFEAKSSKNDIALLKLSNYVQFSDYIKPVCLWPSSDTELNSIIGKAGMVTGWGLDEQSQLSNILKVAKMPVIGQITCLEANRAFFGEYLSVNNYCAGYRNGTSVCNGDSGGGMVFEMNGVFHLRGIVSLAEAIPEVNECNPREYVLFTDAAKFLNFIQNNI